MYFVPYCDSSGLHIPTYQDILDYLIAQAKAIFGNDIYLGNDSLDYQDLSNRALMMYDNFQVAQLVYNNRSPVTAIGSGLDAVVKINGLTRRPASYSTCLVTITGTPGTVILNGLITDVNGNKWDLLSSVTIPIGGTIATIVTCETYGPITALPGDINIISTPTSGWTSVGNTSPAVAGVSIETDSQLRARQAISTMTPSLTMKEKTLASVAAIDGTTRYTIYENDTDTVDVNNLPSHSIKVIVEGGSDAHIWDAIYKNRGLGCYMDGDEVSTIVDAYGSLTTIRFSRPVYVPIYVNIDIHILPNWVIGTENLIVNAISDYLNSLKIGEMLTCSSLYYAALSVLLDLTQPSFSIYSLKIGTTLSPMAASDIVVAYNEVIEGINSVSPEYIHVDFV